MAREAKIKLTADASGFKTAVSGAANHLKRNSEKMQASWKKVQNRTSSVIRGFRNLALVGGVVVASFIGIIKTSANTGDAFQKMALRTGATTEFLSGMSHVIQLAGGNVATLETAIRLLSKRMLDVDSGLIESKRSFDRLGISVHDSEGNLRAIEKIFPDVLRAFGELTNETEKVPELQPEAPDEATTQFATVTYVVDGDTIEISTGERVRLIGMDTPERGAPYYTEAKNKLSKLVLNKQIRMEKDVSDVDRYSRLLRYLYIGDTFVNLEMVEAGYATTYTYPPDVKYSAQFLAAEQEARNAQLGLWASSITPEPLTAPSSQTGSFTLPPCASSDCDCGHFATRAYAQWFYDNYDPSNRHRLDGDRDGLACESLP